MTLAEFLAGLMSGTITVPAVYFIVNQGWVAATRRGKYILSFVVPILLAMVGYLGLTYMGVSELPATFEEWFNALWPVMATAYITGQGLWAWLSDKWPEVKIKNTD